ncbi:MAG: hypothetical protein PHX18_03465 [Candidatus Gastranaerophilales bacterium]|nr:hypothetical protein [Candidatus Gastranaerophilales bacterium]
MRNYSILAISLIFGMGVTFAKEIAVEITPVSEITTCRDEIQEGDYIDFKVLNDTQNLKKGDIVTGMVTHLEDNGPYGKSASILIEHLSSGNIKLNGNVYADGEPARYKDYYENLSRGLLNRGKEIHIKPNRDVFTVYMEQK